MSTTTEIRAALQKGSVPMTTAELMEALGLHGAPADEKKPVYQAISNGVRDGHFIRHHSTEGLRYSLNAERSPGKRGRKRKGDAKAAPPSAPEAVALPPPAPPPAPRLLDFDLRRRLDAIATDLTDAISDACDAQHSHALIKALVVSREAVSRAQTSLPA